MASPLSSPLSPVFLRQALCSLSSPVQRAPPLVGHLQQQLITPQPLQVTFPGAARLPAAGAERKLLGNYEHRRGRPPWSPEVTPKLGLPPSRAGRQAVSQVGSGRACRALLDPDAAALRPKHSPFRPDRDRAGHREGLAAGAHSEPRGSSFGHREVWLGPAAQGPALGSPHTAGVHGTGVWRGCTAPLSPWGTPALRPQQPLSAVGSAGSRALCPRCLTSKASSQGPSASAPADRPLSPAADPVGPAPSASHSPWGLGQVAVRSQG